jgi:hypothetical protein
MHAFVRFCVPRFLVVLSHFCALFQFLEKRNSNGVLLSSVYPIKGLNYLTLDTDQNPWFTFSYSWIGEI